MFWKKMETNFINDVCQFTWTNGHMTNLPGIWLIPRDQLSL